MASTYDSILELTGREISRLGDLLADAASDAEDDGRTGSPDSVLLWKLQKLIRHGFTGDSITIIGRG